jgi:hypothetical protein
LAVDLSVLIFPSDRVLSAWLAARILVELLVTGTIVLHA